jgi:hypothetical protein
VSGRSDYGSAPFASVMTRINDVTFAKGLRCNGKTGVNKTLMLCASRVRGKLACTVLRGPRFREEPWLPSHRALCRAGLAKGILASVQVRIVARFLCSHALKWQCQVVDLFAYSPASTGRQ